VSPDRSPNRLIEETSPYLLQHAYNPVDWLPWGPEALERARREDKPILLSIGYAACHWCHVMERESFEDAETAERMNDDFVCVKVDREERPDLDAIYMDAVQTMNGGQGGWPMTVFLTPDGAPFFAGTYFPKEARHGLPAFTRVLQGVAGAWRDQRARAEEQGRLVAGAIGRVGGLRESADPLSGEIVKLGVANLRAQFDPRWGGFGEAPKFPQPMTLEFLLRAHLRGVDGALDMVTTTLDRMAAGGIYDQVGGGFHRYSTDERWHVPHFEKMLYDNAQLASLYLHAWQVTGQERFQRVTLETLDYLVREMRHPDGGFFSSQDADSEGVEGKYFVWSWDELLDAAAFDGIWLGNGPESPTEREELEELASGLRAIPDDAVVRSMGAIPEGNWEGTNVLWRPDPRLAEEARASPGDIEHRVGSMLANLRERRPKRVPPTTDDKVLVAWNAMAISALAEAGRAIDLPALIDAAVAAADFVLANLRRGDGRLLRSWREGKASPVTAYLDDYALLADALLTLYETTFELRWFEEARTLAADMLHLFRDPDAGGFFQTGSDAETLLIRPKELFDNAVPSGNSAAALMLQRLALLTGEPEYERAAVSALRLVRDLMERAPSAFGHALCALDLYVGPAREVAIVGDPSGADTRELLEVVRRGFRPNAVLAVAAGDDTRARTTVGLLRDRPPIQWKATAYVCERFVCRRPVTEPTELEQQLSR
jgi:uncharacterized protein YyaL (SSP411 family)